MHDDMSFSIVIGTVVVMRMLMSLAINYILIGLLSFRSNLSFEGTIYHDQQLLLPIIYAIFSYSWG